MTNREIEPHHIEVTAESGGSKWIRGVISHTVAEIKEAMEQNEILSLLDEDGGETTLDLEPIFMIRFQDDEVFRRRSKKMVKKNGRRRS